MESRFSSRQIFIHTSDIRRWLVHTGAVAIPRLDAIAAKDTNGKLWLEITNLDPNEPVEIEAGLAGITAKSASGETLTGPKVDSVNTCS